jgi:hypothetical protein
VKQEEENIITDSSQIACCGKLNIMLRNTGRQLRFDDTSKTVSRKELESCLFAIVAISVMKPTKEDVQAALKKRTVTIRNLDNKKLAYVDGLVKKNQ